MPDLQTLLSKFLDSLYAGTVTIPGAGTVQAGNGTAGAPSYSFAASPTTGLFSTGANQMEFATGGVVRMFWNSSTSVQLGGALPLTWPSTADATGAAADAGISRVAAATLAVGNGTAGDFSGTVKATLFQSGATVGVTTFGPAAVASITVKGGIITAIS